MADLIIQRAAGSIPCQPGVLHVALDRATALKGLADALGDLLHQCHRLGGSGSAPSRSVESASRRHCSLGHATRTARGTKPALFATERHQLFGMAVLAAHTQEARFRSTALQPSIELLLHVVGQRSPVSRSHLAEYRIVLLEQPIQQRGLGPMPRIAGGWMKRSARGCGAQAVAGMRVPGNGRDHTGYAAHVRHRHAKSRAFWQIARSMQVHGERVLGTMSE